MSDEPDRRPEGALIIEALARHVPKISQRAAARRAEISETRWRQIVQGYQQLADGVRAPVTAPPETLARMAAALDIRPEELLHAGRGDAAEALEALDRTVAPAAPSIHPRQAPELSIESEESLRYVLDRLAMQEERVAHLRHRLEESRSVLAQMQAMVDSAATDYEREMAKLAESHRAVAEFQRRHFERRGNGG